MVSSPTTFSCAALLFETLKAGAVRQSGLSSRRRLQGFNQLFDEANEGTKSWRYGIGLDWRVMDNLFVGAEATWRDITFASISFFQEEANANYFDHDEQTQLA